MIQISCMRNISSETVRAMVEWQRFQQGVCLCYFMGLCYLFSRDLKDGGFCIEQLCKVIVFVLLYHKIVSIRTDRSEQLVKTQIRQLQEEDATDHGLRYLKFHQNLLEALPHSKTILSHFMKLKFSL